MTPQDVKPYLDSFINYELNLSAVAAAQFNLDRVKRVLFELGDPQQYLKCIHVAGSKGKGSTCAFIASILRQAGYKVGLYTSPHLKRVNERVRILSLSAAHRSADEIFPDEITDQELAKILSEIKPILENFRHTKQYGDLSYYEVLTIAALCHFRAENVDWVVLETGLGGRLDATNVVDSLVCAITPISLEHTQILGTTIAAIAKEKAAIIKANRPMVIIAPQEPEAFKVIEKQCGTQQAEYHCVGKDIIPKLIQQDLEGLVFEVRGHRGTYRLKTSLLGMHQIINAATAIGVIEALQANGAKVSVRDIAQGVEQTQWPGRFEVVGQKPYIILDCAHNPSSSVQLVKTMQELFPGKKARLVFGVSKDKDRAGMCCALNAIVEEVILTKAAHPRAGDLSIKEMQNYFSPKPLQTAKNLRQAIEMALHNIRAEDIVLVTGSIFIIAEAREYLSGTKYASHR